MLSPKPFTSGKLTGTKYTFAADDVLPKHVHDAKLNHITIVCSGHLVETVSGREMLPGQVIEWPAGEYHEFKATEPSVIVNILSGLG